MNEKEIADQVYIKLIGCNCTWIDLPYQDAYKRDQKDFVVYRCIAHKLLFEIPYSLFDKIITSNENGKYRDMPFRDLPEVKIIHEQ